MNWWEVGKPVTENQPSSEGNNWWEVGQPVESIASPGLNATESSPLLADGSGGAPSFNHLRNFANRGSDILSGLATFAENTGNYLESKIPLGGFVPDQSGGFIPDYVGPERFSEINAQEGVTGTLDQGAKILDAFDAGFVPQSDFGRLKESFKSEGLFDSNTLSELGSFGVETGISSIADMIGMAANLPAYVGARAGEIGEKRAENSDRADSDIGDTAKALPAAIGTALLERIGVKGFTDDIAKKVGQDIITRVPKDAAKAATKEAATEFIQEGVIEYLGETLGTNKELSVSEALDRGIQGAVGGGFAGGSLGGASSIAQNLAPQESIVPGDRSVDEVTQSTSVLPNAQNPQGDETVNTINDLFQQGQNVQDSANVPQGNNAESVNSDLSGTFADTSIFDAIDSVLNREQSPPIQQTNEVKSDSSSKPAESDSTSSDAISFAELSAKRDAGNINPSEAAKLDNIIAKAPEQKPDDKAVENESEAVDIKEPSNEPNVKPSAKVQEKKSEPIVVRDGENGFIANGLSKVKTSDVFNNDVSQIDKGPKFNEFEDLLESGSDELTIERVRISDIVPTQKFISLDNLDAVQDVGEETGAELYKRGDKYYVADGHHRIAVNAIDQNDSIMAKVFDDSDQISSGDTTADSSSSKAPVSSSKPKTENSNDVEVKPTSTENTTDVGKLEAEGIEVIRNLPKNPENDQANRELISHFSKKSDREINDYFDHLDETEGKDRTSDQARIFRAITDVQRVKEAEFFKKQRSKTTSTENNGDVGGRPSSQNGTKGGGEKSPSNERIDDFGEKIGGARKDLYGSYIDKLDKGINLEKVTLAKVFPAPDYKKLAEGGADLKSLAYISMMRSRLGSRATRYRKSEWEEAVKSSAAKAKALMTGVMSVEDFNSSSNHLKAEDNQLILDVLNLANEIPKNNIDVLGTYSLSSQNYSFYRGEKDVKKYLVSTYKNGKRQTQTVFDNPQDGLEFIKKQASLEVSAEQKTKGKRIKIDLFRSRDGSGLWAGKKVAAGKYIELKKFDQDTGPKGARLYIDENYDDLIRELERKKQIPDMRRELNNPRVGKDHRGGVDVTPEKFSETFGFRGVEFGNWVEQSRRQEDLNNAYDGLMDMVEIIGVPARAISLNGELALAFGARGRKGAAAHFEPGSFVINLTKVNGAGSLAHEWWHSLDNMFGGRGDRFATRGGKKEDMRQEVSDAYKNIISAIGETELRERSLKLDARRVKDYWSTRVEMTARSFEKFVIDKAASKNQSSDYLANIQTEQYWDVEDAINQGLAGTDVEPESTYPYPTEKEAKIVNQAYQELFDTIETRQDSDGNVELFSETEAGSHFTETTIDDVNEVIKPFLDKWKSAPLVTVVEYPNKLPVRNPTPNAAGVAISKKGGEITDIYLVSRNLKDQSDIKRVLLHEVIGHAGIRRAFSDITGSNDIDPLLKNIFSSHRAEILREAKSRGLKTGTVEQKLTAAEEWVAKLAETEQSTTSKAVNKLLTYIRKALRAIGIANESITKSEILNMLAAAERSFKVDSGKPEASYKGLDSSYVWFEASAKEDTGTDFESDNDQANFASSSIDGVGSDFTTMDAISTNLIDRFHSLVKAQKKIGNVPESQDADLAVTLYPGAARARMDEMSEQQTDPLINLINDSKYSFEEIGQYLHARHAQEANKVLQQRNPDIENNNRLSGMSDTDARKILNEFGVDKKLQDIVDKIDEITSTRVKQMVSDGLITQDEANAWTSLYDHYVPLNRLEVPDALPGRGSGFDIRGNESKFRAGSFKEVDHENMVARIIAQSEASMVRAEKNKVSQTLFNLAEANPEPDLWRVNDIPQVAAQRGDGTAFMRPNVNDKNVIAAKFDGETKYLYMNPNNPHANQIAAAFKNLNGNNIGRITRGAMSVNRWLSAVNTSLSPEFVISNFFRDFQTAAYNLTDTELADFQKSVLRDVPKSMAGIRNALRGDGSSEYAKTFKEFRSAGGMTGWMQSYDSAENRMKAIKKELSRKTKPGKKQFFQVLKSIEDYNAMVENAVRLSAYKNGIEAGLSKKKSARIAKQLTVDFNRKGEWGSAINAYYLFYNASIQGTVRMLRAIVNPNNKKLHAMLVSTVVAAGALDVINRMFGGDDDDGESFYDKIPEHVRDRNLVLMDYFNDDGSYIKIPLPWGYNIFHIMGQELGALGSNIGGINPEFSGEKAFTRLMASTLQAFNPVQDGSVLQTLSPTIVDPLTRISENKDWHGGPLYPNYNSNDPNHRKFYNSARSESKQIASWLAESSMDKATLKSSIDLSPEWLDMTYDFVTGSAGRVVADTFGGASKLIKGEEIEDRRKPIIRKIKGKVDRSEKRRNFYDSYYEILNIDKELRKRKSDPEYKDLLQGIGNRKSLIAPAKAVKKQLRALKKKKKLAQKSGNKKAVDNIETRIDATMQRFMVSYRKAMYSN